MHPMYEYVTMPIILVVRRATSCCVTSPQDVLAGSVCVPKPFAASTTNTFLFPFCGVKFGWVVLVALSQLRGTINRQQSSLYCL